MATTTGSGRKRATASKTPDRTTSSTGSRSTGRRSQQKARTGTQGLHVHTAHPRITVPYVTRGDLAAGMHAAESVVPRVKLPPPERLALYGGLGALAIVGAVDWPVAAAIGVATAVARRGRRD